MKSGLVTTTVRWFLSAVLCLTLILGVTVQEARAFPDYIGGIGYEYYEYEPGEILSLLGTDFDTLTPVAEGITENFNISLRQRDYGFVFRFKAHIEIVAGGNYTFYTCSDDGSLLYVGETLVVNNDGWHMPRDRSGSINLSAGYHPITVMFCEGGGGEVLEVSYEGPGISKQLIPDNVLLYHLPVAVSDNATTNSDTPIEISVLDNDISAYNYTLGVIAVTQGDNGCVELLQTRYEYYEIELGEIFSLLDTDFDTLTPVAEGIAENFNILLRQRDDYFAFRFKAHIEIVAGGNYTFYTCSDDASLLYIGETLVVNNDMCLVEKSGAINLSAGYHPITVMFCEYGGGQMLEVSYEGPGVSKQLIPDNVLGNGMITYTPNAGFYGTDSFTYKVNDGRVDSNFATVSITVNRVIAPPETMLEELRDYVDSTGLPEATKDSLNSSLEVAISALEDSNPKNDLVAANVLKAFINKVEAQRGKKISEGFADELITKAQEIAAALE